MRFLALLLLVVACGANEQEDFEINGELKKCQILEAENCGLRVVCEDDTIYRCVTN